MQCQNKQTTSIMVQKIIHLIRLTYIGQEPSLVDDFNGTSSPYHTSTILGTYTNEEKLINDVKEEFKRRFVEKNYDRLIAELFKRHKEIPCATKEEYADLMLKEFITFGVAYDMFDKRYKILQLETTLIA